MKKHKDYFIINTFILMIALFISFALSYYLIYELKISETIGWFIVLGNTFTLYLLCGMNYFNNTYTRFK